MVSKFNPVGIDKKGIDTSNGSKQSDAADYNFATHRIGRDIVRKLAGNRNLSGC